jgi:uncharacterized UBP type Zn finger protein
MKTFTKSERITTFCSSCTKSNNGEFTETKHNKNIGLWAVPPLLLVQLKRFKNHGAFAYKLNTLVNFPLEGFDVGNFISKEAHNDDEGWAKAKLIEQKKKDRALDHEGKDKGIAEKKNESKNMSGAALRDSTIAMIDALPETLSREKTIYDLYAVCNHSGQLGSGHYFTFARDKFDRWRRYDDSYVATMGEDEVQSSNAYLLFYKRRDVADAPLSSIFPRYNSIPRDIEDVKKAHWNKPERQGMKNDDGYFDQCRVQ